jgi:site-specific DNA recombinase
VKRAALYPRVSSRGQEEEGTSLGTQEQRCREYAAARGYVVDEEHVYREVHTGTELWERPQLAKMREAVRRREVDVVVAFAIDRLSRE